MDYKTHIAAIESLQKDLATLTTPNSHDRDALTRCVTLKRSLAQSVASQAADQAAVAEATAQLDAALAKE